MVDNGPVKVIRFIDHHLVRGKSTWWLRAGHGLAVTALIWPGAWASDSHDHEKARAALEAGQVLPLPTLLERLRRTHPAQVLELELEREGGRWIYEVKLLQADGQLLKLKFDAATGQVVQTRRKADRDAARLTETPKGTSK